jgi:hypothetical protein
MRLTFSTLTVDRGFYVEKNIFAYVSSDEKQITTWKGEPIGQVIHTGRKVRQGGWVSPYRQWVRVRVSGATYGGWSQGGNLYIKLRLLKSA